MTEKTVNNARVLFDKERGEILVGNDIVYDGELIMKKVTQSQRSTVWHMDIGLDAVVVLAFVFVDNGDGTHTHHQPVTTTRVGQDRLELVFASPVSGFTNVFASNDAIGLFL